MAAMARSCVRLYSVSSLDHSARGIVSGRSIGALVSLENDVEAEELCNAVGSWNKGSIVWIQARDRIDDRRTRAVGFRSVVFNSVWMYSMDCSAWNSRAPVVVFLGRSSARRWIRAELNGGIESLDTL